MGKENQRTRYLLKNTAIFTIGNIATKFITFFLVPLYTNVLSTSQFGTVDLINTVCSVLAPILILNISESVMRFSLDKDADYSKILNIGVLVYGISIILGLLIFPINSMFKITADYSIFIYFHTITFAGCQLFLCYLRGKEMLAEYAIGGVIQTLSMTILNIVFLVNLKMGVKGYFLAIILSSLITMVYAGFIGKILNNLSCFRIDKSLFHQMTKYSIILIPNTFMWWIMNASDRLMVTSMIGTAANGVYAISYKLPTLVSTFTTIFNQAWSYSAIKEVGANDEVGFNNKVLNTLTSFSMLVGIGILTFAKPFLRIYVAPSYYSSWKYVPFLTIGSTYMTLGTFMSTSYTVHKDSFGYLFSAIFGATLNIIFNFGLIPYIGVYGAALATCISYIAVFVFRAIHTRKYIKYYVITKEFVIGSILLVLEAILMFGSGRLFFYIQLGVMAFAVIFYAKSWLPLMYKLFKNIKKG